MKKAKTDSERLEEISSKLGHVIALLAIQGKDQDAQIKILYSMGMDANTIGRMVGLSSNAVRLRKFRGFK